MKWAYVMPGSEPGSQAFSERQQQGSGWGERGVWWELSPPSPLLLLSSYTIVGALGIAKLHEAWSSLSRSRGSHRGEMHPQVSQRWARCDDCLERGRRGHRSRDSETVREEWTRGLLAEIEGKDSFWRERLDQGRRGEELCSGSIEWLWYWHTETAQRDWQEAGRSPFVQVLHTKQWSPDCVW